MKWRACRTTRKTPVGFCMRLLRSGTVTVLAALLIAACASTGGTGGGADGAEAGISARGAIGRLDALSGPFWTGDGGANIRLAVLAPQTLGGAPGHLPMYIQGLLNSNLKRHSAMTLIDRQNLDRIIAEQDMTARGRFSDADYIRIGNLTNARYLLFGSLQKLSGDTYALHLSITETSTGEQKAVFTGNGSLAQLEGSGALINRASAELLAQLGVNLTEAGRRSLMGLLKQSVNLVFSFLAIKEREKGTGVKHIDHLPRFQRRSSSSFSRSMSSRCISIKRSRVSFEPLALPRRGFTHSPAVFARAGSGVTITFTFVLPTGNSKGSARCR
jgi:hypothetical protein